jgi:hypothetical protein
MKCVLVLVFQAKVTDCMNTLRSQYAPDHLHLISPAKDKNRVKKHGYVNNLISES